MVGPSGHLHWWLEFHSNRSAQERVVHLNETKRPTMSLRLVTRLAAAIVSVPFFSLVVEVVAIVAVVVGEWRPINLLECRMMSLQPRL